MSAEQVAKGNTAYQETCAACHGVNGRGMPGLGKDLVEPSDWFKQQDNAALVEFLKQGRPATHELNTTKVDMPPRGGNPSLTDEDLTNIVGYIRTLKAK